jgi:uncharacterized protein with HEPN domain
MTLHDPSVTLRQMRDYAVEAMGFAAGRSRSDLDTDRMLQLALVRLVEVVGEAATRLPKELRDNHPSVPWRQIISARNRLIHGYDNVSLDLVWLVIQDDLPPLVREIETMLDELGQQ